MDMIFSLLKNNDENLSSDKNETACRKFISDPLSQDIFMSKKFTAYKICHLENVWSVPYSLVVSLVVNTNNVQIS